MLHSHPSFIPPLPTCLLPAVYACRPIPSIPTCPLIARRSSVSAVCSSLNSVPGTDQELLGMLTEFHGERPEFLPSVRTYRSSLSSLRMVGSVPFNQALTAAAADGGRAAEDHMSRNLSIMVVEALFPGSTSNKLKTVSTRLFLPTRMVKEKAIELENIFNKNALANAASEDVLASAFRQVVLERLWNFELVLFGAGAKRKKTSTSGSVQGLPYCSLSSSDTRLLGALLNAICSCALEIATRDSLKNMQKRPEVISSFMKSDTANSLCSKVLISKLSDDGIVERAKNLVGDMKQISKQAELMPTDNWLAFTAWSRLAQIGGPGFSVWASKHVAAYNLQIIGNEFEDLKLRGWQKSVDNKWEVFLSHAQLVDLASILDIYYEDQYTIPDKELLQDLVLDFTKISSNKRGSLLWRQICMTMIYGCMLLLLGVVGSSRQISEKGINSTRNSVPVPIVGESFRCEKLEASKIEDLCCLIVMIIKEVLDWSGKVITDHHVGAWIGNLPSFLKEECRLHLVQENPAGGDNNLFLDNLDGCTTSAEFVPEQNPDLLVRGNFCHEMLTAEDICTFQVVLSQDGKIIGFMPKSLAAINHWANNPLATVLHGGRKLSPGILEPCLKIPIPSGIVEIELLMPVNPAFKFALARPVD